MPFGLINTQTTFQRMMDQIFADLDFVRTYLDYLVVFLNGLVKH